MSEPVGQALRDRRIELGLSQHELSRRTGVPQATLSDIERGKCYEPRASVYVRLCDALALDCKNMAPLSETRSN